MRILVEVAAGAREARFPDGYNVWRDGRIGIRVRAAAQEGRANEEVVRSIAQFMHVATSAVTIEAGPSDARKTLRITGMTREQATTRLTPALGDA